MTEQNSSIPHKKPSLPSKNEGLLSYFSTLYDICQEENITLELLSNNWVVRLEKNGQVHYIVGYKFDLNPYAAGKIADDKVATYAVLSQANIPVVEHTIIYEFHNQEAYAIGHNSLGYAKHYLDSHNSHIVVKPTYGTGGAKNYQVKNPRQLVTALSEIFYSHPTACLSPFYKILHEYRVILLDGAERLSYMKTLPDQRAWKFNLQQGAIAEPIPAHLRESIVALAKRAVREIGLRFCSIDIIETANHELLVLEINSGVMTNTYIQQYPEEYDKVKNIYRDAVKLMFG